MAIYRAIQMSFWTDPKVVDDFTPEDRYFYLYIFTNPHTNLAGCYEISVTTMASETGYGKDSILKLIDRMEHTHNVIRYSKSTKEILIFNWHKYNWTSSDRFRKPLKDEIDGVKDERFRDYLTDLFNGDVHEYHEESGQESSPERYGIDTVYTDVRYGIDTTVTDTVTVSVSDTVSVTDSDSSNKSKSFDYSKSIKEHGYSERIEKTVQEWIEYKRSRNQTYKEIGLKALLSKIDNYIKSYGEDALIDAITQSIANNYQGIVWDRGIKSGGSAQQKRQQNMNEWRYA